MAYVGAPVQSDSLAAELDALLAARWPAAKSKRRIRSPADLPLALAQYTKRLLPNERWRAYTDGAQVWFVMAHRAPPGSDDPAAVTLELHFFATDGTLCASGIWRRRGQADWKLYDVMDIPVGTSWERKH
jgi:hypothetical protein